MKLNTMKRILIMTLNLLSLLGCTHEIHTEITLKASPQDVWKKLTDTEKYPEWNPFILELKGELKKGETLSLTVKPAGDKPAHFKPKVLEVTPEKKLAWKGSLPIPGLFVGQHEFLLEKTKKGTRFIHREFFSGILLPFLNLSSTEQGFHKMNEALKENLEG